MLTEQELTEQTERISEQVREAVHSLQEAEAETYHGSHRVVTYTRVLAETETSRTNEVVILLKPIPMSPEAEVEPRPTREEAMGRWPYRIVETTVRK